MTAPFKTPIRLLWPLAIAAPLLAGCAGGLYPPPPPYPALGAYPPGPRLSPMVRPGARVPPEALLPIPNAPTTKEPASPVRLAPDAAGPAAPTPPISAPAPGPTPEPTPRPLATIDARPPGTRCGWWELCNLWE
jgi:hypothetical protein